MPWWCALIVGVIFGAILMLFFINNLERMFPDKREEKKEEGVIMPEIIYILWGEIHSINQMQFFGAYKNKEDCLNDLKRQQEFISVEIIEYSMQEYKLR